MTVIRFLHEVAFVFFVGGQLALAVAVVPAVRRYGTEEAMRAAARRFGRGSGVALIVLIATGVAMASHFDRWGDSILHWKLAVLAVVLVLLALHVRLPSTRALALATLALSLLIVWLGVSLAH